MYDKEVGNLFRQASTVRVIKQSQSKLAEHLARKGEIKCIRL